MKQFLEVFLICLVVCFVTLFFLGGLLLSNIWAIMVFIAFLMAISITAFMHHEDRIEALEKKLAQLQGGNDPPPEE